MTGRSLHDALLRVLTSAELRRRAAAGDERGLGPLVGVAEGTVLCRADPERLLRLARFLGRHFYRERIVRLFAASRRLARERGADPLGLLETLAFDALLESAEVGSAETAERVATLVEARVHETLGDLAYARDLVAYEGALFRTEAGPRRWGDGGGVGGEIPTRSPHARIVGFEWDVTGLATSVRRGDATLPDPPRVPTRLLVALSPEGRVTTVRAPDIVERLLAALDGVRSTAGVAAHIGVGGDDTARALRRLAEIGAVGWRTRSPDEDPSGAAPPR